MLERWCKNYINKWLHVEKEPPEGWILYCFYKIYFRWRNPFVGMKDLQRNGRAPIEFHRKEFLKAKDIHFTHPVAGDWTDFKLKRRIKKLRTVNQTTFTQEEIQALLPSINNIRVIWHDDKYKVCDGNGRVYAFQVTHPNALIEVDIVKPCDDPVPIAAPGQPLPKKGDLRIEKKYAEKSIECIGMSWTGMYYSLEEYFEDWQSYSRIREWRTVARVPDAYPQLTFFLTHSDPKFRKLGQMLHSIVRGESKKKEQVSGN